jgi:hypothetical protein
LRRLVGLDEWQGSFDRMDVTHHISIMNMFHGLNAQKLNKDPSQTHILKNTFPKSSPPKPYLKLKKPFNLSSPVFFVFIVCVCVCVFLVSLSFLFSKASKEIEPGICFKDFQGLFLSL